MEKTSKEQSAINYCEMKQQQSLGSFTPEHLFIMRFAYMAGYDKAIEVKLPNPPKTKE